MKRKHRKPTEPFGYLAFGKNGTVRKHMSQLPDEKEPQEIAVMQRFVEGVSSLRSDLTICSFAPLPEADHDFRLITSKGDVTVQLTELVERDYAKTIAKEEYKIENYQLYIQKEYGAMPLAVDPQRLRTSLKRSIEKKVEKHYAKTSPEVWWLVIFCTSPYVRTEYFESGQPKVSDVLVEAREYLRTVPNCVFDEIWYANPLTRPVRIWPEEG